MWCLQDRVDLADKLHTDREGCLCDGTTELDIKLVSNASLSLP